MKHYLYFQNKKFIESQTRLYDCYIFGLYVALEVCTEWCELGIRNLSSF